MMMICTSSSGARMPKAGSLGRAPPLMPTTLRPRDIAIESIRCSRFALEIRLVEACLPSKLLQGLIAHVLCVPDPSILQTVVRMMDGGWLQEGVVARAIYGFKSSCSLLLRKFVMVCPPLPIVKRIFINILGPHREEISVGQFTTARA